MRQLRARRKAAGLRQVVSWVGAKSSDPAAPTPARWSTHRVSDARSLALHVAVARKIDRDRSLLKIARRNLQRWARKHGDGARPRRMLEWAGLLRRPWSELASRMTALTEDGARLRKSSPFAGVLTQEERRRIYQAFRA
jgi:hypothetical protein